MTFRPFDIGRGRLALVTAMASLFMTFVVARAHAPPTLFTKYVQAATQPSRVDARVLDYSPLYLSLARTIVPRGGPRALLVFQCLLHAGASVAIALSVSLLAARSWAVVAGLWASCYRPFLVYAGTLEPEILVVAALSLGILCGIVARRDAGRLPPGGSSQSRRALLISCAAGVSVGLLTLLRPVFLLLLPLWGVWIAAGFARRVRLTFWSLFVAGFGAIVIPVVLSSWLQEGTFVIMNPGPVFYEGNGPGATGLTATRPEIVGWLETRHPEESDYAHIAYRRIASFGVGRPVSLPESNAYWTSLSLEAMRAHPAAAARRVLAKGLLAASPYEAHDENSSEVLDRRLRSRLPWGFGLMLLTLPALSLLEKGATWDLGGLLALAGLAFLVQVLFYASARQRLPLATAFAVLGPVALAALGSNSITRARRAVALSAGALLMIVLLAASASRASEHQYQLSRVLGPPPDTAGESLAAVFDGRAFDRELAPAAARLEEGRRLLQTGEKDAALIVLEPIAAGSLTRHPLLVAYANYFLARHHVSSGDLDRARKEARTAARIFPSSLRIIALAAALDFPREPTVAEAWRPPGYDPVSARLALSRELKVVFGAERGRQTLAPLLEDFPELESAP